MQKLLMVCLLAFILVPAAPLQAQSPTDGLTCRYVIVREEADIASEIITELPGNVPVTVLEQDVGLAGRERWDHIRTGDVEGWVFAPYIGHLPRLGEVGVPTAHLRSNPTLRADIIADLHQGQQVEVLETDSNRGNGGIWYHVRVLESGQEGWIKQGLIYSISGRWCYLPRRYVQLGPNQAIVWSNIPADLLEEPIYPGRAIAQMPSGTFLEVLSRDSATVGSDPGGDSYLSQVRIAGTDTVGWLYSDAVYFLPLSVLVKASELNIRAMPSSTADITGQFTINACLDIVRSANAENEDWFYVREPATGREGWISADYVSFLPATFYRQGPSERPCPVSQ